eukprot:gene10294-11355_t
MDTLLKPARLDLDPNSPTASKEWKHWHRTFTNFIAECGERAPDEYRTLINYVSHNVYEFIEDRADYDSTILALERVFVKTPSEIFARHLLATRRQKPGETLSEFLQELHRLSKDCNLKSVTAEQYREELANALDLPQKNAEAYGMPQTPTTASVSDSSEGQPSQNVAPASPSTEPVTASFTSSRKCYFCGDTLHNRKNCPARDSVCKSCGKKGHYAGVCKSKGGAISVIPTPALCSISAACPESLAQASVDVSISGNRLTALIDSGSTDSYINESIANKLDLKFHPSAQNISMAQTSLKAHVIGHSFTDITIDGSTYPSVRLGILKGM